MREEFVLAVIASRNSPYNGRITRHRGEPLGWIDGMMILILTPEWIGHDKPFDENAGTVGYLLHADTVPNCSDGANLEIVATPTL